MCRSLEAAEQRLEAAQALKQACEEGYGIPQALCQTFRPVALDETWVELLARIQSAEGRG